MLMLNNNYHRVSTGHPVFMPVHMFVRTAPGKPKEVMTAPYFHPNLSSEPFNVLLTCNNTTISQYIKDSANVALEEQPLTVAKHMGEVMQIDVVVILNTYCEIPSKQQAWDMVYHKSPSTPPTIGRSSLQHDDAI